MQSTCSEIISRVGINVVVVDLLNDTMAPNLLLLCLAGAADGLLFLAGPAQKPPAQSAIPGGSTQSEKHRPQLDPKYDIDNDPAKDKQDKTREEVDRHREKNLKPVGM